MQFQHENYKIWMERFGAYNYCNGQKMTLDQLYLISNKASRGVTHSIFGEKIFKLKETNKIKIFLCFPILTPLFIPQRISLSKTNSSFSSVEQAR